MSDDPMKPVRPGEEPVSSSRPSAPSSDDLHDYLPPDNAATEAMLDALMAGREGVPSPDLVARLKRLDEAERAPCRGGESPWAKGGGAIGQGAIDQRALPSATRPTAAAAPAPASTRPMPLWWAYAAVAAVFVPVIVTIVVMRFDAGKQPGAAAVVETAAPPSATTAAPKVAGTATVAPRATASADGVVDAGRAAPIKLPGRSPKTPGSSSAAPAAPSASVAAVPDAGPAVPPEMLH
jgi:hypothetical protein